MAAKKVVSGPAEVYRTCKGATELWALVRNNLGYHRYRETKHKPGEDYNTRLLYLLATATFRRVDHLTKPRPWKKLLRVLEAYADGEATIDDLEAAQQAAARGRGAGKVATAVEAAYCSIDLLLDDYKVLEGIDYVGDAAGYLAAVKAGEMEADEPLGMSMAVWKKPGFQAGKRAEDAVLCALVRDVFGDPFRPAPAIDPAWLAWNDGTVTNLARTIYDKGKWDRLPILADALEEAGCGDVAVLGHCRGPGPHVRGCWVVDLQLGKK